ncbi:MAG: hypothetical protein WBA73_15215 [Devosia sp.]
MQGKRWTGQRDRTRIFSSESSRTPILKEVYYPRVDSTVTRDFELLITGPDAYLSEENRDCYNTTSHLEDGVPAFRVTNTARDGRYRVEKQIISDPARLSLIQRITFTPLGHAR